MHMLHRLCLLVLCLGIVGATHAKTINTEAVNLRVETLKSGFSHPWGITELPDGDLLITERNGNLKRLTPNGLVVSILGTPKNVFQEGQGGLLDIALAPDFATNQRLYLSYAAVDEQGQAGTEVMVATLSKDVLIDSRVIFKALPKRGGGRHFGSRLLVTPEYLYITLGDRGHRDRAQFADDHLGTLVRLHHDGTVPESNPFVQTPSKQSEVFSFGHRNIQGIALDNNGTRIWAHEHGPQGGDELNVILAGENYGWPTITHGVNYGLGTQIGEGTSKPGMRQPVYYWDPSIAPSGMTMVNSQQFPMWQGDLLLGSLKFGLLVRLELENGQVRHEERMLEGQFGRIRDVIQARDGSLLILTDRRNGSVLRVTPLPQS
ncbi:MULTISPECIES: PQQ-dependent sugar dehydrogenase [unclassified Salinivibrio]|uniref:PQQ-dependent sugar dehydrogenase n=1 Tax=unclassified Salinivibrio TaxID=2636825 RepID=UPI00098977B0|nr:MULTISPECIES: PQQ-dependent sugar dehydrogenase [unclassified Salinivibrio]MPS30938.1 PQQ-dependent sugar dehydrogenase [Salinivibrio sp. VYel7]MPX92339.1 PQQ-dependent sugar dehydrogenase [Salinivibrio sp. VYel9]MPX97085.1 PQQ-dependent sugar dehydrogenase [Salinivibrio sp. VYel6]MPX98571.1 PQQ-dependent sugar dehydrogenase [Salinivibrio sp. VYel4]MPY01728.1 PQQ-dependent sugar dehydrogenase [Salinivibrio sp. VYel5]